MLDLYLFQLLNGLGLGMIYFLIAVGLTIIFGLLNFVNFAHGAFFLLGAYLCYTAVAITGNFWLALLIAPLVVAWSGRFHIGGCWRPECHSERQIPLA